MQRLIQEEQLKYLGVSDIERITEGKCRVALYSELADCTSLEEAAAPYDACVCLFETKPRVGHWICWFRVDENTWEWFDSYGARPDSEFKWITKETKEATGQEEFITRLIAQASSTTKMIWNQVPLQKLESGINTCGRWVAVRIRKRNLKLAKFQELFYKSGDFLVTMMTLLYDKPSKD